MGGEAVLRALQHVWLVLKSANVPAAVAGGMAMAAWKYVRATQDVILHKLLAGRIIDWADVAALLRANRESLDLAYLLRWVCELELDRGLTAAWGEAFPGVPLPRR